MRKLVVAGFICLGIAVQSEGVSAEQTVKFGHVYPTTRLDHSCAVKMAEQITERTDGRYNVQVFPNSSIGNEDELHEGLSLGTVDIAMIGSSFLASVYPPIGLEDAAYVFRDYDHWKAYSKSDLRRDVAEGYNEVSGNNLAGTHSQGFRHILADKAINKPADMAGAKIRVPNAPNFLVVPNSVGANPAPIAYSETYMALQQGVVDMVENPLAGIMAMKFYEARDTLSLTGHVVTVMNTVISGSLWSSLSVADKDIFAEVIAAGSERCADETERGQEELLQDLRREGVKVNEVDDRSAFVEAAVPYVTDFDQVGWTKQQYERLKAIK